MSLFGTNGVRGVANVELTTDMATGLAKSFGTFKKGTVAVGRDTRESGEMVKACVIAGLLSTGCKVIDLGIAPTPAIQYFVRENKLDMGIIVTASHNPPEYNGIKGVAPDGTEFSHEDEAIVEEIYNSKRFYEAPWNETGGLLKADACTPYIEGIISKVDVEAIRAKHFKVIADTGCGAACVTTPFLLRKLGCKVVTLNAQTDGTFPGRNPEPLGDEIKDLRDLVISSGADLGVAHDGDADRAVYVDETGTFVNEDVMLAIMSEYALRKQPGILVTPVSSSSLIGDIAEKYQSKVIWTQVGSIYVAREMRKAGAVFGGEGNGGLIFPEFQYCRDGGMATAKILEMLAHTGKKMSGIVKEIPAYCSVKDKIKCKDKAHVMKSIAAEVLNERTDLTDGIKVFKPEGWVLIRMSGTEPIIRVFAESNTVAGAKKLAAYGVGLVNQFSL